MRLRVALDRRGFGLGRACGRDLKKDRFFRAAECGIEAGNPILAGKAENHQVQFIHFSFQLDA